MRGPASDSALSGLTVAAMLIAAAQTPLASTMIAVALPDISGNLLVDIALATSLLVTTYMALNAIGQGPGGKLADVLGRWRTLKFGIALCAAGSLIGTLAAAFPLLVVARCLIALGGALIAPSVLALLRAHFPAGRRGRMFGAYSATVGLAAAIGPPLGGELVELFGWRAIFAANLPMLAIAAVALRRTGGDRQVASGKGAFDIVRSFDWVGTLLLAACLLALGAGRAVTVAAAALLAAAFFAWEWRSADPILEPRLFSNRVFAAGCLVIFLQSLAMYGLIFQLPQFFELLRGASPSATGYLLLAMMLGLFVTSVAGGSLSDRIGARTTSLLGVAAMLAGILWLNQIAAFATPADAYPAVLLVGAGLGVTWAPSQSSAMSAIEEERSGMAAGATTTCRYLGGALGVLLLAGIVGADADAPVEAHVAAIRLFGIAILLSVAGCLALPGRLARKPA